MNLYILSSEISLKGKLDLITKAWEILIYRKDRWAGPG